MMCIVINRTALGSARFCSLLWFLNYEMSKWLCFDSPRHSCFTCISRLPHAVQTVKLPFCPSYTPIVSLIFYFHRHIMGSILASHTPLTVGCLRHHVRRPTTDHTSYGSRSTPPHTAPLFARIFRPKWSHSRRLWTTTILHHLPAQCRDSHT